jgi:hypothetical protein
VEAADLVGGHVADPDGAELGQDVALEAVLRGGVAGPLAALRPGLGALAEVFQVELGDLAQGRRLANLSGRQP